MLSSLRSQVGVKKVPEEKIDKVYKRYRFQAFLAVFIGYMVSYFVRNNLAFAAVHLKESVGFTKEEIGWIFSFFGMSYGISKLVMGFISDRSNPRVLLAVGLIFSGICNLLFPCSYNMIFMIVVWFLNGWVLGMAWPPCAKVMTHWFSDSERGTKMAWWNISHNLGAAFAPMVAGLGSTIFLALNFTKYEGYFWFPGIIAIVTGILYYIFAKDIPANEGLPTIEEYKNDYPKNYNGKDGNEPKLKLKDAFFKYILRNKVLWFVAIANVFVYVIRGGIGLWIPTFLRETRGFSDDSIKFAFMFFEIAAIISTPVIGWASDKIFHGRRTPVGIICLIGIIFFTLIYWYSSNTYLIYISVAMIGALVYGPMMLIGISAIDSVPTNASGIASGFTGLFGYLGGQVLAGFGLGSIAEKFGWNSVLILMISSCALAIFFLSFTWNAHNTKENSHE